MALINAVTSWLSSLFVTPEEEYLSRSVDLADFERRQRIVERAQCLSLYNHMWY